MRHRKENEGKTLEIFSLLIFLLVMMEPSWLRADEFPKSLSMLRGLDGWAVTPLVTVGNEYPSHLQGRSKRLYRPPGRMDGIGVYLLNPDVVRVLVNHELWPREGAPYQLRHGPVVTGARVSFFDLDSKTRQVINSGLAYEMVIDRQGEVVTHPHQINQNQDSQAGFASFCSAHLVLAGNFGFVDTILFTHEEVTDPLMHPYGGTLWALHVDQRVLHAVPAVGRMAFENSAPLPIGGDRIALLIGDDAIPQLEDPLTLGKGAGEGESNDLVVTAPLWLYIGKKNASLFDIRQSLPSGVPLPADHFLNRNGLLVGDLYYWVPANGRQKSAKTFHGTGQRLGGVWKNIAVRDPNNAGQPGYDQWGYKNGLTLRREAKAGGAFQFARPEDLSTHPRVSQRAVFASTGRDVVYKEDAWGTIYQVDVDVESLTAVLTILYDAEDAGGGQFPSPDFGIRNPDNILWADDEMIYIQEDPAKSREPLFGQESKEEASVWQFNPQNGTIQRVAQIDRGARLPSGATDNAAHILGAWESSGMVDVTRLFQRRRGEHLFLATIQAHSVQDGVLADAKLVEAGQLVLLGYLDE